jgi:hypothetical protein
MLGAPRGAECCTDHGKLLVRPELCVRNVMGHLSRSASSEARRGERGGSGGALRRREAERDKQLGARVCMVSDVEALELANVATMTDLTDLRLPSCELRADGSFVCQPPVCEECSPKLAQEVHDALLQYTEQQVHLKKLEALPTVDDASESTSGGARSSGGGGGGGGGGGSVVDGGGGGSVLDGSVPSNRRSTRASACSTIWSILASSSINVLKLKLLIFQETDWPPSQQRLFIDGDELLNDEQSLSDAGVLPNSFIHVYIDTSRVAELPTFEGAFGDADKTKTGPLEDGFANSALSYSFLSRARAAPSSSQTFDSANEGRQRRDGQFVAQPEAKETEHVAEEVLASNEQPGPAERRARQVEGPRQGASNLGAPLQGTVSAARSL